MRLKGKMLAIALIPVALLTILVCIYTGINVSKAMKEQTFDALQATVYAARENVANIGENVYTIDENDHLWNIDRDLTLETEMIDEVKAGTGIVVTVFYGDTRYQTSVTNDSGQRVLLTQAGEKVINTVLKGASEYHAENVDVVGSPYYAYYVPLYDDTSADPVGMVFAGKAQSSVEDEIKSVIFGMIGLAVALFVVAIVAVFVIAGAISKRIGAGVDVLAAAADGDLTAPVDAKIMGYKDETGDIMRSVSKVQTSLREVVGGIVAKSKNVSECAIALGNEAVETVGTVEQVERAVTEIAEGATSQAADTTKATENVITMGNLVEETNDNVSLLTKVSGDMEASSKNAAGALRNLEEINRQAKESIDIIYEQTNTTNESAKKISEAIVLITSIAEETNLLSLNASIEAARAGEQGRGFAVVASQISKLAEQSNESAKKIEEIVKSLMADSEKAVETMNEVNEIMAKQNDMVENASDSFGEVLSGIEKSRDNITEISTKMEGLNVSRETVVDVVSNLSAIAEENAASTQETSASTTVVNQTIQEISSNADRLKSLAAELEEDVSIFKI